MFKWIETNIGQGVSIMINNAGTMIKSKILGPYLICYYCVLKFMNCAAPGVNIYCERDGDQGEFNFPGMKL